MATSTATLAEPCPFELAVPEPDLEDLRARLHRTRLPDEVEGVGWSQGLPLDVARRLLDHWRDKYDWRREEAAINAIGPQFVLRVSGIDVHYVHIRAVAGGGGGDAAAGAAPPTGASAAVPIVPVLLLHGWPGTFYEFRKFVPELQCQAAAVAGGGPFQLDIVVPSLPGFGFSSAPTAPGFGLRAMARLLDSLMAALGYGRYVVQGGDLGALVAQVLARQAPNRVAALHLNMAVAKPSIINPWHIGQVANALVGWPCVFLSSDELQGLKALKREYMDWGSGYSKQQSTRPQTLAYALTDSPVGLMAWIVEKYYAWSDLKGGDLLSVYTPDELLTTVSIYWLGGRIASSLRHYWENFSPATVGTELGAATAGYCKVPTGFAWFPKEIIRVPRAWLQGSHNLQRYTKYPTGGHFAALEEPEALAKDVMELVRTAWRA